MDKQEHSEPALGSVDLVKRTLRIPALDLELAQVEASLGLSLPQALLPLAAQRKPPAPSAELACLEPPSQLQVDCSAALLLLLLNLVAAYLVRQVPVVLGVLRAQALVPTLAVVEAFSVPPSKHRSLVSRLALPTQLRQLLVRDLDQPEASESVQTTAEGVAYLEEPIANQLRCLVASNSNNRHPIPLAKRRNPRVALVGSATVQRNLAFLAPLTRQLQAADCLALRTKILISPQRQLIPSELLPMQVVVVYLGQNQPRLVLVASLAMSALQILEAVCSGIRLVSLSQIRQVDSLETIPSNSRNLHSGILEEEVVVYLGIPTQIPRT